LKNRSLLARAACGLLAAAITLTLTGCGQNLYKFPQYNFAGRPIPPSGLANRVMVAIDNPSAFSGGQLEILDANRDIRNNIENTVYGFFIAGYSGRLPTTIASFPEEEEGYVYGSGDGSYTRINYGTESVGGAVSGLPSVSDSVATTSAGTQVYAASGAVGGVIVVDNILGRSYALNLPGAQHIVANPGNSVILVTTRNTNNLYRILKLSNNVLPTGAYNDCEPLSLPVYCVVPVQGTFDRPDAFVFSLDGSTVYVLNCGPECGDTATTAASGVTVLNTTNLNVNNTQTPAPITGYSITGNVVTFTASPNNFAAGQSIVISGLTTGTYLNGQTLTVLAGSTTSQFSATFTHATVAQTTDSGLATVASIASVPAPYNVAVPGGATIGLTDGVNLYVAGQELVTTANSATGILQPFANAKGYFTGVFSILPLPLPAPVNGISTPVITPYSIPDGTHSSMLFADDNTLWIGSTLCTTGARGYQSTLTANFTPGTINLNCLAAFTLGQTGTVTPPQIVPAVSPEDPVPYPNQDNNQYYYGDLTGICWVESLHKVYTAYGGQIHAFMTNNLTEINNSMITVQGTAENVVYMDASTNAVN